MGGDETSVEAEGELFEGSSCEQLATVISSACVVPSSSIVRHCANVLSSFVWSTVVSGGCKWEKKEFYLGKV